MVCLWILSFLSLHRVKNQFPLNQKEKFRSLPFAIEKISRKKLSLVAISAHLLFRW